jgi:hypothetical protein
MAIKYGALSSYNAFPFLLKHGEAAINIPQYFIDESFNIFDDESGNLFINEGFQTNTLKVKKQVD